MIKQSTSSRRAFLRNAALASGTIIATKAKGSTSVPEGVPSPRPNVLMICADQFRTDFVGANGENPSTKTPNINSLAARGVNFSKAVCNQPLCSPSRASFLTSMNATNIGVWKLNLEPNHSLPTIATTLKQAGYSTNFIGKWHISSGKDAEGKPQKGWIPPGPSRSGFDDRWEGANVLEVVSHPTEGNYWDNSGTNIGFKNQYRVDFITNRAVRFLEEKHDKPWLLFLSQLEPHQQNDVDAMVPPERYAKDYDDPFIPQDLRDLPGNWRSRIGGYYGCVQAIDDCVGRIVATLGKTGQLDNTIIVFFSDHGCHFRTRMGEYKRSPHEAALRVPLIFAGPGFDQGLKLDELVSLIDMTPTLLDGCGLKVPVNMQGKTLRPLMSESTARKAWDSTVYIQISESMVGRAIRTRDWMFSVYDPEGKGNEDSLSKNYVDFAMYQLGSDPYQKLNLIGRPEYKEIANQLREELKKRIVANGEPEPTIKAAHYFV
jgi:arylsulfatase A-like enzyme